MLLPLLRSQVIDRSDKQRDSVVGSHGENKLTVKDEIDRFFLLRPSVELGDDQRICGTGTAPFHRS